MLRSVSNQLFALFFALLIAFSFLSQRDKAQGMIKVKDAQLYYDQLNKTAKETIIFIHGGYLDHRMWDDQFEFFSKNYRVLRYCDLGHGKSISGDSTIYAHEALLALMNELKIEKAHLMGLSWGALVATDFVLTHPEKVNKMILVSPGLNGWSYFVDPVAKENYRLRREALSRGDTTLFVEFFQRNWTDGPNRAKAEVDSLVRQKVQTILTENIKQHLGGQASLLLDPPAIERLTEIQTPTLLIKGQHDAKDIHEIVNLYQEKLAQADRFDIHNAAHMVNMERPEIFNQIVELYLKN